ncbi:hypothetical protein M413DRAFT_289148 [Hebeloma cylindrosporum]|uniref:Uncharacterized protein n=1 Tax=Hebeloma cylindrosporum TaxID=76867 RepID=A0A0C3BYP6_HEBCY|nr:hypothetical protein M413DRAFT_289148 [Hebeloma cylindrosporum h7]
MQCTRRRTSQKWNRLKSVVHSKCTVRPCRERSSTWFKAICASVASHLGLWQREKRHGLVDSTIATDSGESKYLDPGMSPSTEKAESEEVVVVAIDVYTLLVVTYFSTCVTLLSDRLPVNRD